MLFARDDRGDIINELSAEIFPCGEFMTDAVLASSYDYRLVVLSILIAITASYAAFDLAGRVTGSYGRERVLWLAGGTIAMGIGIWSMHYTAMTGFHLPVPVQYHWPTMLLSLGCALFGSFVALFVVSRRFIGYGRASAGAVFQGGGIVALHYTAMASMRMQGMQRYSPLLVGASIVVGVGGALLSLHLMLLFRDEPPRQTFRKIASAILMGAGAISGMHYTAMAAATFIRSSMPRDLSKTVSNSTLAIAVVLGSSLVLVLAITACYAGRVQKHKTLLDQLFEEGPQAVALVSGDNRVMRVNREFTRLFGYTAEELEGKQLVDMIVPDEYRTEAERTWESVRDGQRVDTEGLRRRKDRQQFYVAVSLVPFSLPGGEFAVYEIYRDVTERKRADDSLRKLSGQLVRSQDDERRRLARELHDSTGQKLAALGMHLAVVNESRELLDARARSALAETQVLTDDSLREIRTLAYLLHPPELEEVGLADAVYRYVNGFIERSGIHVYLEISPDLGRLPEEIETALFRILQESLSNIHRHSGSPRAGIQISRSANAVTMEVRDEGHGIQTDQSPAAAGVGIAGMRERARQLGGQLDIHSNDSGTTLIVILPLS